MARRISQADNMFDLMIDLTHNAVSKTHVSKKKPIFTAVMPDHEAVEDLFNETERMCFAEDLEPTLLSNDSPEIDFFLNTPKASSFTGSLKFALYNTVMSFPGLPDEVYFGTAAHSTSGHTGRMKVYDPDYTGDRAFLPSRIRRRLDEGWKIVHVGFVVWMDMPPPEMRPRLRLLMLAIEATLTFAFWAGDWSKVNSHKGFEEFCLWKRPSLSYNGLCTHSSMNEPVYSEIGLTLDELEIIRQQLAAKTLAKSRRDQAMREGSDPVAWKAARNAEQRERMQDPVIREKAYQASRDSYKKTSTLALATKQHYCEPCEKNFSTAPCLQRHLDGPFHAFKLRELDEAATAAADPDHDPAASSDESPYIDYEALRRENDRTTRRQSARARAKKDKKTNRHYCQTCSQSFTKASSLKRHLAGPTHKKEAQRVAKLAKSNRSLEVHGHDNTASTEVMLVDDSETDSETDDETPFHNQSDSEPPGHNLDMFDAVDPASEPLDALQPFAAFEPIFTFEPVLASKPFGALKPVFLSGPVSTPESFPALEQVAALESNTFEAHGQATNANLSHMPKYDAFGQVIMADTGAHGHVYTASNKSLGHVPTDSRPSGPNLSQSILAPFTKSGVKSGPALPKEKKKVSRIQSAKINHFFRKTGS
jgi:hypothetical protein